MNKYRLLTFDDKEGKVVAGIPINDYHKLIGLANKLKKANPELRFEVVEVKFEVSFK